MTWTFPTSESFVSPQAPTVVTPTSLLQPKSGLFFSYGLNMELIWFLGNLEILLYSTHIKAIMAERFKALRPGDELWSKSLPTDALEPGG